MAIEDFFNHTCNIYHVMQKDESPGYGLPASPTFLYPEKPDNKIPIPCHFNTKGSTENILQKEPQTVYQANIKLNLPFGTDIRVNDKVVHLETGYEYTAGIPKPIQEHHLAVYLRRITKQEAL